MTKVIDLSGQTFNFLTALNRIPRRRPGDSAWVCRCICGSLVEVQSHRLRTGRIKSCGCKRNELLAAGHVSHGHWVGGKPSPEWVSWRSAIDRCHNPNHPSYGRYGGAGIQVCEQWRTDFSAFARELGSRPKGATLDRIDSTRGYEPGNCKWSTPKQQSNHLKNNRFVLVRGERLTIRDASDKYRVQYDKFRRDLYRHGRVTAPDGTLFSLLPPT